MQGWLISFTFSFGQIHTLFGIGIYIDDEGRFRVINSTKPPRDKLFYWPNPPCLPFQPQWPVVAVPSACPGPPDSCESKEGRQQTVGKQPHRYTPHTERHARGSGGHMKILVRYILSNVCLRLIQISQLSFIQCMGLCVFSLSIYLMVIVRIHVSYLIIIIISEVWPICHCLGLDHETMVCALCLSIFL